MSRCDSAAMVPKTSELLPEPETPVNTVSRRFGSSMLTSFRLFSRAPCTRMRSWLSATGALFLVATRSAALLDADQVAGRVTHRAVAHAVRLLRRLFHHFGFA